MCKLRSVILFDDIYYLRFIDDWDYFMVVYVGLCFNGFLYVCLWGEEISELMLNISGF